MILTLETPTKLYVDEHTPAQLKELEINLTYTDMSVTFEIRKFKNATWYAAKYGEEAYQERLDALKATEKVSILHREPSGRYHVPAGLLEALKAKYNCTVINRVQYPEAKNLPWAVVPEHKPYAHQTEATEKLLAIKHGRVELATGVGKSTILLMLVKQLGLKAVVMAPSGSITDQLYKDFSRHLGVKNVGKFYGGKKEHKKLVTIATGQSLTRVEPGTPEWESLSSTAAFLSDESHVTPATTFEKVCNGVFANTPYRFFVSGTQLRGDGSGVVLDGITGSTVLSMTVQEGVAKNILARPSFRVVRTTSPKQEGNEDPNEATRRHLFYNPNVLARAGAVINHSVANLNHQVLVLVDEMQQFTSLLPYIKHPVKFAHGPLGENKSKVPQAYWESNPNELVAQFNASEFPVLIASSCVSTGTDFKSVKTMIYLRGGKSEVEVRQGVGRCTRLFPALNKTACTIVDFDVTNIESVHRHALARKKIFNDIYPDVTMVDM